MIQWKCGKRKGANGGLKRRRGGEIKPAERSVCAAGIPRSSKEFHAKRKRAAPAEGGAELFMPECRR